ncbi:MAG: hypothetical protein WAM96_21150, partial [Candidatus Acidiferrales bacterium]
WLKEMKEQQADGGKLLASARALLVKYADTPEPQPPQPPQPRLRQPRRRSASKTSLKSSCASESSSLLSAFRARTKF